MATTVAGIQSRLSRRHFLAAGLGVAGAVTLAGCGSKPASKSGPAAGGAPAGTASYQSRTDLHPPKISVSGSPGAAAPGYFTITDNDCVVVDNAGEPVWIRPVPAQATNLRVQSYQGSNVLTWWQGRISDNPLGVGRTGEYVIVDGSYRQVVTVQAQRGLQADLHEFNIIGDVAYFTAYGEYRTDLQPVGGPSSGTVLDAVVQGVNLATGQLVFDWHAKDHIELSESYEPYSKQPYDSVHLNSVAPTPDGKLLLSARHTWALYKIDPATGDILWRMGGKKSDFTMGKGTQFAWQHDAKWPSAGVITVFNDASDGSSQIAQHSSGLVLNIDESAKTVSLGHAYVPPISGVLAGSQGSMQVLPDGHVVVGWGSKPYYTEYHPQGPAIVNAKMHEGQSYRAYKFPWTGTPTEQPAIAVQPNGSGTSVYASWNGSTETAKWQVLGGSDPTRLAVLTTAPRRGFETTITVSSRPPYVAVRALDSAGKVLATSPSVIT